MFTMSFAFLRTFFVGILVAGFVLSGGMAVAQAQDPQEVLVLRERVAEYWAAKVNRDDCRPRNLSEPRAILRRGPEMPVWKTEGDTPKRGVNSREYQRGRGAIQYLGHEVGDRVAYASRKDTDDWSAARCR